MGQILAWPDDERQEFLDRQHDLSEVERLRFALLVRMYKLLHLKYNLSLPEIHTQLQHAVHNGFPELAGLFEVLREDDPFHCLDALLAGPDAGDLAPCPAIESDPAVLAYTSGPPDDPKGVILTHGNLLHAARENARVLALGPEDLGLCLTPLAHVASWVGAVDGCSGCHCTPSNGSCSCAIASMTPSSARASTRSPAPSSSTA